MVAIGDDSDALVMPMPEPASTVPYRHIALLARHVRTKGLAQGSVLRLLETFESEDLDIEGRVCAQRYAQLLHALNTTCEDPYLWFEVGSTLTPPAMGHLGQLLTTAPTLRVALRALARFYPLLQGPTELWFDEEGDGKLCMATLCPPGSDEERLHAERVASGGLHTVRHLAGIRPELLSFEFTYAAPPSAHAYYEYLKGPVAFSRPCHRMTIPEAFLDVPLAMHDAQVHQLLNAQCERYLRELAAQTEKTRVVERVAQLIRRSPRLSLSLDAAARQLAVSPRTLSRRLADEQARFDVLRELVRKQLSAQLLLGTELSVATIADRVGFDDASNFARAFSRWHGMSPSRFRRSHAPRA